MENITAKENSSKKVFISIITAAVVTFILHLIWEQHHVVLYGGYENLSPHLPITIFATIGDVAYTLGAFVLVAIIKKNLNWISKFNRFDFIGLILIGFFISTYVEYKALALNRWFYLDTMPIIPGFEVGLSPIIQMTVLLPVTFWLTYLITKKLFK